MKKATPIMIIITMLFVFTVLGVFIGRRTTDGDILIHTSSSVRSATIDETEVKPSGLININTADAEQLQELPGVGPAMAEEIIAYREEHGDFKTKRDLLNVKGIGEKTYEELKSMITVKQ